MTMYVKMYAWDTMTVGECDNLLEGESLFV